MIAALAERLDRAAREARPTPQLEHPLTLDQAYDVQAANVRHRLDRGEVAVGVKMGFTSRAKMVQMGLSDLIFGRLTSGMRLEDGGTVSRARFIHPRIEPEIAFVLSGRLSGEVSPAEALRAVGGVAPALELIDSRYADFKFSLADVIADNTSAAGFVVGGWSDPARPFDNLGLVMEIDGVPAQIGSSAAILGDPLRSLAAASRLAARCGMALEPGWIVLAGGATAAVPLAVGHHVRLAAEGLGRVQLTVVE